METLPRHVQGSGTRGRCRRIPKNPRKVVARLKKGKRTSFLVLERNERGLGGLVSVWQFRGWQHVVE